MKTLRDEHRAPLLSAHHPPGQSSHPGLPGTHHEYPYYAGGRTYDDDYLVNPILAILRALGARRVLDVGCGNGTLCGRLSAEGFDVVGCDPSGSGIRLARASYPHITFKQASVYDEPGRMEEPLFDAVVAMEVVEHLYLPRCLPRFAGAVLKSDGRLIVSTPYHGYLKNLALALLNGWDVHWSPLWDGGHIKFWSPGTLRVLLESEGFSFERWVGAGRLPWLWKSMVMTARVRDGAVPR